MKNFTVHLKNLKLMLIKLTHEIHMKNFTLNSHEQNFVVYGYYNYCLSRVYNRNP